MIPIRDTVRSRTFPAVTILLILLNVLLFGYEVALGPRVEEFVRSWALLPAEFTQWRQLGGSPFDPWRYVPLLTSMFLHGGWAHVGGNMLYLWVFGDNVEDRLGHGRFLFFYLACGASAAFVQILAQPESTVPVVGASGAIAGVLGAYFIMYPKARVLTIVPIFIFPWFVHVPAILYLGLWFVLQLLSGTAEIGARTSAGAGIAWWAHAGGFIAGAFLQFFLRKPAPRRRARSWE